MSAIVVPAPIDEEAISPEIIAGEEVAADDVVRQTAIRRAAAKASAVAPTPPTTLVLGADTAVEVDGRLLDKPAEAAQAREMLAALVGRTHAVHTAVAIGDAKMELVAQACSTTMVTFGSISGAEMDRYIASGEWQGVAGGYRIQGSAAAFVSSITGSYSGVVGLPLHLVYSILSRLATA